MKQRRIPASFVRGGTSKALVFHARDLPEDMSRWKAIFLSAMGSPDPFKRQLDGMGGGLSSVSKVAIVGPPTHPDADIDYTFVQVLIDKAEVSFDGNCGNISAAIGPWAVDEGLLSREDGNTSVAIHNTNTGKIIISRFETRDGVAETDGDLVIDGVPGSGARVALSFLEPGGTRTGHLFPTGQPTDILAFGELVVPATLIDAANPYVFLDAQALGLKGNESPQELAASRERIAQFETLRRQASVKMGICADEDVAGDVAVPLVGMVAPHPDHSGSIYARLFSMGQPHRALPGTASIALSVAAAIPDSVVSVAANKAENGLLIHHAAGVQSVNAQVIQDRGQWRALSVTTEKTQRRLFEGAVLVRDWEV